MQRVKKLILSQIVLQSDGREKVMLQLQSLAEVMKMSTKYSRSLIASVRADALNIPK